MPAGDSSLMDTENQVGSAPFHPKNRKGGFQSHRLRGEKVRMRYSTLYSVAKKLSNISWIRKPINVLLPEVCLFHEKCQFLHFCMCGPETLVSPERLTDALWAAEVFMDSTSPSVGSAIIIYAKEKNNGPNTTQCIACDHIQSA